MHSCTFCKEALVRRREESPSNFRSRKYCEMNCYISHREEKKRLKGIQTKVDLETIARATKMASGRVPHAVLDPDAVRSIRELAKIYGFTTTEIADFKKLKRVTVEAVLAGRTWRHVV